MSVEQLITAHLDIWTAADTEKKSGRGRSSGSAGSVYGVKKLRELILELAVRGKLVPQDESDEPASELLKRIAAEKAKLIAEGKIKKSKPLAEIMDDEKPFELPINWKWAKLGIIGYTQTGATPSKSISEYFGSDIPFIKPGDIYPNYIEYSNEGLSFYGAEKSGRIATSNSLLMVCIGTIGKCNLVQTDCSFNQQINSVTPYIFNSNFLLAVCRSVYFNAEAWDRSSSTTIAILNKGNWEEICIPIPPLAEQHRIVAKVDELMALCDQLENQHNNAAEAHEKLVTHLLGTLTQSQNAEDFSTQWQRISEHFDTLFTTEASIDALKQTLLQLAVMGKLVPQDPNDESVRTLLHRVKESEAVRVKNKEIQKPKKVTTDSQPGISIPESWAFKTLNEVAFVTKLAGFEYTEYINLKDEGEVPVVRAQNVRPFLPKTDNLKFIDLKTSLDLPRSALDRPSLLVTFIGAGIGDVCLFNDTRRWHLAPNVAKVEPFANFNLKYLTIFMNSPEGRKEIFKSMKSTAQPSLSMGTIREIWVPIPPSQEQLRIAAKVDELMAICDKLKAGITSSSKLQQKLADVLIEQTVN